LKVIDVELRYFLKNIAIFIGHKDLRVQNIWDYNSMIIWYLVDFRGAEGNAIT
jgi:hypothetical protein